MYARFLDSTEIPSLIPLPSDDLDRSSVEESVAELILSEGTIRLLLSNAKEKMVYVLSVCLKSRVSLTIKNMCTYYGDKN